MKKAFIDRKLRMRIFRIAAIVLLVIGILSCEIPVGPSRGGSKNLISPSDFTSVTLAPDGVGYLQSNAAGKRFMHLEGNGYQMGYQHGYLLAPSVQRMTSEDFVMAVLAGYLNMTGDALKSALGDVVVDVLMAAFRSAAMGLEGNIPAEYLDELRGIRDGAAAAGYAVSYNDLMVLNVAFDVLLGVAYPIVSPILGITNAFAPHMCDGFVTYGSGTTDGRTIMGRNFMFTDAFIHEEALLVEYKPASGNRFVAPTIPGWAGLVSGMNTSGIGIGVDMAPAVASNVFDVGMGVLFAARRALQHSSTLSEGVNSVRSADLGVSWIVAIGSGKNEIGGAVIETSAVLDKVRSTNYKYPWYYLLLPLPRQIESKSDLVVFANHFIVPEMALLTGAAAIQDSKWRYETLTNLILSNYGSIDVTKGKQLVDYLHPPAYGYYGTDPNAPVKGIRSLYDLKNGEIWSLFGHYNDQWVDFKF
jgi:hypothetical protein